MEPEFISVEEAAALLGCGRTKVFELIAQKRIERTRKVGRKTLVVRASVIRYMTLPDLAEKVRKKLAPRAKKPSDGRWTEEEGKEMMRKIMAIKI